MRPPRCLIAMLAPLALTSSRLSADTLQPAWAVVPVDPAGLTLPPGLALANTFNYPWFDSSNGVRGVAANPVTGNVLIAKTNADIKVLNASGVYSHTLAKTGVGGGILSMVQVGVAADGVVIATNLTVATPSDFKLYRWENDKNPDTVVDPELPTLPTLAFSGDPAGGTNLQRWGDTLDVKGSGLSTKIVVGARNNPFICIFDTQDGTTFTPHVLPSGGSGGMLGLAFGPDITGYDDPATAGVTENLTLTTVFTKLNAGYLYRVRVRTDNWTVVGTTPYDGGATNPAEITKNITALGTDAAAGFLGGVTVGTAGQSYFYDIRAAGALPSLVDSKPYFTSVTNGNAIGAADVFIAQSGQTPGAGGLPLYPRFYALNTNNAVIAYDIKPSLIAPNIVTPPASSTVLAGWKGIFSVTASGSAPLTYQWLRNDVVIPGATSPTYLLDPVSVADSAAVFKVVVSNGVGPVTSAGATLTVQSRPDTAVMTPAWKLAVDSRPYLSGGDNQRGLAWNPSNDHLLVINRSALAGLTNPSVVILEAATGAEVLDTGVVRTLQLTDPNDPSNDVVNSTGGATNGYFALNTLDCDAAGVIYAANLAIVGATGQFKIYRWSNDDVTTTPTVAYGPADLFNIDGIGDRAGEHIKVRGSGVDTQILVGARNEEKFAILTTTDGLTFTPAVFNVPDARPSTATGPSGAFFMCDFGAGNTIWAKSDSGQLLRVSFDLTTGQAAVVQTLATALFPSGVGPITVDPVKQILGGVHNGENPNNLRLYNYNLIGQVGGLLDLEFFPTDNVNGNRVGAADIGNSRIYALDTNNGLVVMNITYTPPVLEPAVLDTLEYIGAPGGDTFRFTLKGTTGKTYRIEGSDSMSAAAWTPVQSITLTGPSQVVDIAIPGGQTRYYFRAVTP